MEKVRNTWKGKSVALFLLVSCFFLFNWPLISIPAERGGVHLISYIFLLWFLVIFGFWFYCRNAADDPVDSQREDDQS